MAAVSIGFVRSVITSMALVSLCDNCEADYLVDSLVYVELVKKNLCACCINDLLDRFAMEGCEGHCQGIIQKWEDES